MGPFGTVKAEGFGIIKVAAAREVSIGDPIANDPVTSVQMGVQGRIGGLEASLHEANHLVGALVFG